MPRAVLDRLPIQPDFDLEDFLNFTHETKISSQALDYFYNCWQEWLAKINAVQIKDGERSWVVIWLPEEVEKEIDMAWEKSPLEGFLINGLAQYMCMAAIEELLPEVSGGGCAPAPAPLPALTDALRDLKLIDPTKNLSALTRRYAILTYYPFRGGCETCAMEKACPKHGHDMAQVVLPGYEPGVDV